MDRGIQIKGRQYNSERGKNQRILIPAASWPCYLMAWSNAPALLGGGMEGVIQHLTLKTSSAKEREARGFLDLDVEHLAREAGGIAVEDDDFVAHGAAAEAGSVVF